ncbi:hypothetical protein HanIR_Chr17g0884451 [Helianthus annuus]|nr:hypothetical protein HanIR_Chr17g0884451 [Helianthus annuus]
MFGSTRFDSVKPSQLSQQIGSGPGQTVNEGNGSESGSALVLSVNSVQVRADSVNT